MKTTKAKTKTGYAKVVAIFTHRTNLSHRTGCLVLFLVPILLLVFWFYFWYACSYFFVSERTMGKASVVLMKEKNESTKYCAKKNTTLLVSLKYDY